MTSQSSDNDASPVVCADDRNSIPDDREGSLTEDDLTDSDLNETASNGSDVADLCVEKSDMVLRLEKVLFVILLFN